MPDDLTRLRALVYRALSTHGETLAAIREAADLAERLTAAAEERERARSFGDLTLTDAQAFAQAEAEEAQADRLTAQAAPRARE